MIFKTKKSISMGSFIFAFVLGVIGFVGCSKTNHPSKIKMYQTLGGLPGGCPSFNWIYTDLVFPGSCIQADNYNGTYDTAFQVAGVCTTTVTDETTPAAGAYVQTTPIIVECATGSLSSTYEYTEFTDTEGGFGGIQVNDLINVTVECSVHGTVRDKQSLTYTYPSFRCSPF